jgi:hypothetical protein
MRIKGTQPSAPGPAPQPGSTTVEAVALEGGAPDLVPGQQLVATVLGTSGRSALVDLGGARVALPLLPGLKPGAELSIRVARTTPTLLLEVAPRSSAPSPQLPSLQVGQEVIVRVVEARPQGRLLIDLQGTRLEAEAQDGLPLGREFAVRVEESGPQLVLRVLADSGAEVQAQATRLLRAQLAHRIPAGESFDRVSHELASLAERPAADAPPGVARLLSLIETLLPGERPPDAEQLAAFVRDGGLHYEAKLLRLAESDPRELVRMAAGDLKGLVLQALKEMETAEAPPMREPALAGVRSAPESPGRDLVTSLTTHLEHIESQQAVNLLAQTRGEAYQLQLPFFTGQGLSTAFLSITPDRGEDREPGKEGRASAGKAYTILFLLDLDGLGQTRIDARMAAKSLGVTFYVTESHSVASLQREFPAFRQTLMAMGYEDVSLAAKPVKLLSPDKQRRFDELKLGVPGSVSLLDVKA